MKQNSIKIQEALEKFNLNFRQRVPVIVSYLAIMIILRGGFAVPLPDEAFGLVFFMLLYSSVLAFYFNKFTPGPQAIINIHFAYNLFDLFLLTMVVYFLGGASWIGFVFYSYYLLLNYMTFPYFQACFLTGWIIFLYLALAFFQYSQLLPIHPFFPLEEQNYFNFLYVLATTAAFVATFILVAYYSRGFHSLHIKKVLESEKTKEILEEERTSLEAKIEIQKRALEEEKERLEFRVEERKKELQKKELELQKRVKELEQFQKVALGREKKLKEMEAEFKKLSPKLKT